MLVTWSNVAAPVTAGIASWGYVVVSPDHLERGLAAPALKLTTRPTTKQDTTITKSSVDRG